MTRPANLAGRFACLHALLRWPTTSVDDPARMGFARASAEALVGGVLAFWHGRKQAREAARLPQRLLSSNVVRAPTNISWRSDEGF